MRPKPHGQYMSVRPGKFKLDDGITPAQMHSVRDMSLKCDTCHGNKALNCKGSKAKAALGSRPARAPLEAMRPPEKKGGRLQCKRPQVKGGNAQGGHGGNNVAAPQ